MDLMLRTRNSFAPGREQALPTKGITVVPLSSSISKKARPRSSSTSSGSLSSLLKGTMKKCNSFASEEASTTTSISKKMSNMNLNPSSSSSLNNVAKSKRSISMGNLSSVLSSGSSSNALHKISRKARRSSEDGEPAGVSLTTMITPSSASPKPLKKRLSRSSLFGMRKGSTGTLGGSGESHLSSASLRSCLKKQPASESSCNTMNMLFPAEPQPLEDACIGLAFDEDDSGDGDNAFHSCFSSLYPKSVKFDVVEVREYAPSLSHNPMVKDGYAVGIGWDYSGAVTLNVNQFEDARPPVAKTRQDLLLDNYERLRILRASGTM